MGKWSDIAAWAGPIPNCGPGVMSSHRGVVIHTAEGSYDGTVAWQRNGSAQVGSHFVTAQDGRVVQLIDTATRSWCQSAGNNDWISIENAGWGSRGEALTPGQVEACARILARAHQEYGVPLQVSNSPTTPGLGWHGMGGAAWGGHTGCPGNAIRAQLPAIVARAAQLIDPQQPPEVPDMDAQQALNLHNLAQAVGPLAKGESIPWLLQDGPRQVGIKLPNGLGERLSAIEAKVGKPAGGTVTQEMHDAAVLKAMQDPAVLKGIGDAVAAHLHVS